MGEKERGGTAAATSMDVSQETLLKLSKEISIKFIEVGRITPASFDECFKNIYSTLESTITKK